MVRMQAVTALLGAVVGGLLVLIGDVFRRRAERRDRAVQRIIDASASYAMVINKTCGEMIDAKLNQQQRPASALRAERHETTTRFFMTPAPHELHDAGRHLSCAYHDLYDHFDSDGWAEAWSGYRVTIRRFEAAVRAVAGNGSSSWPDTEGRTIFRNLRPRGTESEEAGVDLPFR
jgi:hypothetical protein